VGINHYNSRDWLEGARSDCRVVYRMNWGAYVAARGAYTDALSGPVDLRKKSTPQDRPVGGHAKRAIDIAVSATALVLLSPLFLMITALLSVGLGRRVFVAQQRIGFAGRRFTAYLFHTSPNDGVWNLADEPALTTCLISVVRDSGLDRLPQLINILRGDMSFVGPRPVEVGQPGPYCPDYFAARPGLFDMRQVDQAGHWAARRRAAHDRYYVRQWSMWLDLAVLTRRLTPN
jgi:lipopolysaccharide/colanic/teichoic acid biosynthesis glycosyltransferase